MDPEEQIDLLATTAEDIETVKVFPLIPHILRDATVRAILSSKSAEVTLNVYTRSLLVRRDNFVLTLTLTGVLCLVQTLR